MNTCKHKQITIINQIFVVHAHKGAVLALHFGKTFAAVFTMVAAGPEAHAVEYCAS